MPPPTVFLSGLLVNVALLPGWAQGVGRLFPLFYANSINQQIIVPGNSLKAVWGDLVALLGDSDLLLPVSRTLRKTE